MSTQKSRFGRQLSAKNCLDKACFPQVTARTPYPKFYPTIQFFFFFLNSASKVGASGKGSACQCRCEFDPWAGKIPGGGNGRQLQYSCLENPMDKGAWRATVYGVTKSQTRLSTHTRMCTHTPNLLITLIMNK